MNKVITKTPKEAKSKSFNFDSPAWKKSIIFGTGIVIAPANHVKLVAHGVSLGLGDEKTLAKMKVAVLVAGIAKVLS